MPLRPPLTLRDDRFIFGCPRTGLNVQHWSADQVEPDDPQCTYETIVCHACARIHFVNRSTGKLLGEQRSAN